MSEAAKLQISTHRTSFAIITYHFYLTGFEGGSKAGNLKNCPRGHRSKDYMTES